MSVAPLVEADVNEQSDRRVKGEAGHSDLRPSVNATSSFYSGGQLLRSLTKPSPTLLLPQVHTSQDHLLSEVALG